MALLEGIGLMMEKTWAEYLTVGLTVSFLPWELYEVFKRVTLVHSGLLVVNFMVFLYLFKVVVERGKQQRREEPPAE